MNEYQILHEEALKRVQSYQTTQSALIEIISQMDRKKAYIYLGYNSLFVYCTEGLKLSPSDSYSLMSIARKSKEIPELKAAINNGDIHVSNARRIIPVLTPENKGHWLKLAANLSQRKLEIEIARENPEVKVPESIKPVCENRMALKIGISIELETKLRKIQDVLSSQKKKPVSLEEAIEAASDLFLERKDPKAIAERKLVAGTVVRLEAPAKRVPNATTRHEVALRDCGQCTEALPNGTRCPERRWLQRHHVKPFSKGGATTARNLVTLCYGHHKRQHLSS